MCGKNSFKKPNDKTGEIILMPISPKLRKGLQEILRKKIRENRNKVQ
ncbi:hypothetical protein ACFL05_00580 [Patescibacteria group bacterium]